MYTENAYYILYNLCLVFGLKFANVFHLGNVILQRHQIVFGGASMFIRIVGFFVSLRFFLLFSLPKQSQELSEGRVQISSLRCIDLLLFVNKSLFSFTPLLLRPTK